MKLQPSLRNNNALVAAYVAKLRPSDDADWQHDVGQRRAYLSRLWAFVRTLGPVHNSLKAHVLYQRLAVERSQGQHDPELLLEYLKLPRNVSYINAKYLQLNENRRYAANLGQKYTFTLLPPVGNDEPLVRSLLLHQLVEAADDTAYRPYVDNTYLRHAFAEAKILNGVGEPEQWYSLLPPEKYQALKERVDIEFDPASPTLLSPSDPVRLNVHVKNVGKLIVKVFHINTVNYYREKQKEVNTDVALDGLVANQETIHQYDAPPLRRIRRSFQFPQLSKPGVYVIDFIGNGLSSRVVVRKGQLRAIARSVREGQILTDPRSAGPARERRDRLVGRRAIPTGQARARSSPPIRIALAGPHLVIQRGGQAWLTQFEHSAERYALTAGLHLDREQAISQTDGGVDGAGLPGGQRRADFVGAPGGRFSLDRCGRSGQRRDD